MDVCTGAPNDEVTALVTYLATGDKLNRPEFTVEMSAQTAIDFITFIIAVTDIVTFGG